MGRRSRITLAATLKPDDRGSLAVCCQTRWSISSIPGWGLHSATLWSKAFLWPSTDTTDIAATGCATYINQLGHDTISNESTAYDYYLIYLACSDGRLDGKRPHSCNELCAIDKT